MNPRGLHRACGATGCAPDPYAGFVGSDTTGPHVGQTVIGDAICDHYALRSAEVHWEFCIPADRRGAPLLRSTVDRGVPERPRVSLTSEDWILAPRLPARAFDTGPPPGARGLTLRDYQQAATTR